MADSVAFIFPGQGSQKVGMLQDLAQQYPVVVDTFSEASEVLGYDLWALVQDGPQDKLNMTEVAQPALLAASTAVSRILTKQYLLQPSVVAGHSLGEWSALVSAGVLSFADGIRLVQLRGKYMQEAVPVGVGAMAAILGLADEQIVAACAAASSDDASAGEEVCAVNFNSPGQVVIAGHSAAVERAMALCKDAGATKTVPLAVSAPFHTNLMTPAAERLAHDIEQTPFYEPSCPVIHNVHGQTQSQPEHIKQLMVQQIYSPVLWVDCAVALKAFEPTAIFECGPGKVLTGLMRRIDRGLRVLPTELPAQIQSIQEEFASTSQEESIATSPIGE